MTEPIDWGHFVRRGRHGARTPLNALFLVHDIMERGGAEQIDAPALLERTGERLSAFVERTMWAVDVLHRPVAIQAVDLAPLVDAVGAELDGLAVEVEPLRIEADPTLAEAVVREVLTNAARFRTGAGRARVSGSTKAVLFEDWGMGVEPAYRAQAFEPFRRLNAYHEYPGSGLGLWVAREAARRMGGELELVDGDAPTTLRWTLADRSPPPG